MNNITRRLRVEVHTVKLSCIESNLTIPKKREIRNEWNQSRNNDDTIKLIV